MKSHNEDDYTEEKFREMFWIKFLISQIYKWGDSFHLMLPFSSQNYFGNAYSHSLQKNRAEHNINSERARPKFLTLAISRERQIMPERDEMHFKAKSWYFDAA